MDENPLLIAARERRVQQPGWWWWWGGEEVFIRVAWRSRGLTFVSNLRESEGKPDGGRETDDERRRGDGHGGRTEIATEGK